MAKSIKANEEIETTYRSIREIVGSPSLKVIVDKILTKETTYNESLAQIYELEKLNEVYDKDIEQLEAKLKLLKNERKKMIFCFKNDIFVTLLMSLSWDKSA